MYFLFKPHGNTPDCTEPHLQYAVTPYEGDDYLRDMQDYTWEVQNKQGQERK